MPGHRGHHNVREHQIETLRCAQFHRFRAVWRCPNLVTGVGECERERRPNGRFVIDDQNPRQDLLLLLLLLSTSSRTIASCITIVAKVYFDTKDRLCPQLSRPGYYLIRVANLNGMHVLSLESRRCNEMRELIRKLGGEPFVAPSMREAPVEDNAPVWRFAGQMFAGEFDMIMLLTGVGTRQLARLIASQYPDPAFANALRRLMVASRGPKPVAAPKPKFQTPQNASI